MDKTVFGAKSSTKEPDGKKETPKKQARPQEESKEKVSYKDYTGDKLVEVLVAHGAPPNMAKNIAAQSKAGYESGKQKRQGTKERKGDPQDISAASTAKASVSKGDIMTK